MDENSANWLLTYTMYMGVVLQVPLEWGPALVKYQGLIHRVWRGYSGAAWLRYGKRFGTLSPLLSWDREHYQLYLSSWTLQEQSQSVDRNLVAYTGGDAGQGSASKQEIQPHIVC